jgi:hypothetical protein
MMSNEIVGTVEPFDKVYNRIRCAIDKGIKVYVKHRIGSPELIKFCSCTLDELSWYIVAIDGVFKRWDIKCNVLFANDSFYVLEISTCPSRLGFISSTLTVVVDANGYEIINLCALSSCR